jgi:hypothetical protein
VEAGERFARQADVSGVGSGMESKRFDDLSKAVANISSRRHVLKGLVAGAVAGVVGVIANRGADAAQTRRAYNEICRKPGDCADGLTCVPSGHGRSRCCLINGTACNDACCDTLCTNEYGCADADTNPTCYHRCVNSLCFHMNNNFNGTLNQSFNNDLQCELYCAYSVCGAR